MRIGILLVFLFFGCSSVSQNTTSTSSGSAKVLEFRDFAYEPYIRTILLGPANAPSGTIAPALTSLGNWNLVLQFDDLNTTRDDFYAKIIHCNYDWTKSLLMDLDFITQYNEFSINTYEFSVNTHIPYVHYTFNVPAVKIPGNYLLIVYRGGNNEDIVLSKRFMVYDTKILVDTERNLLGAGSLASINQQLNFMISYKDLEVINPYESIKVCLRQNQRWDNEVVDLRPSFLSETEQRIEYRFFDPNKMFKGGSEFRFFDLRSLNSPGRNVQRVDKTAKPFEVYIQKDKSRGGEVYSQYRDNNGAFLLDNYDYRGSAYSNYAYINFTLSSKKLPGKVYAIGAFHHWNMDEDNQMYYDSAKREYNGRILLKQGLYDYQYYVKAPDTDPNLLEGNHYETENSYEIFVYYRPFQPRADLLLGYLKIEKNPR